MKDPIKTAMDEVIINYAGLLSRSLGKAEECSYCLNDSVRILSVIVTTRRRLDYSPSAASPFVNIGGSVNNTVE